MTNVIEINYNNEYPQYDISSDYKSVEYISSLLPYDEYFNKYLRNNIPCVVKLSPEDYWPCIRNWVKDGAPNFEYINKIFGSSIVPVADCTKKYYNSQMKNDMTMSDYIDYWISYKRKNDSKNNSLLYLKDWHCAKDNPGISFYQIPSYFASDWLNEYYIDNKEELDDDYMFVYMGPAGSWTPFHADVFSSYSWSANIVGRKRWLLIKPEEENCLRDKYGQLIYDIESEKLRDKNIYPNYMDKSLKSYEIIQEPGEIVFVPSGWHHQVWNLEDTISINHNWINGCNILSVWNNLNEELLKVMKEIDDCKDMEDWNNHCQLILKTSYGMNYIQFYQFLLYIAKKRISLIIENNPVISFDKWYLGKNHCIYDLKQIRLVLEYMIKDCKDKFIDSIVFYDNDANLIISKINQVLLLK